ncbi:MAG TPA: epoxide hydrolase, partial [Longimicrobium sp.]|nr:epoxide hydrolase [Longimicrobium sp.]
DEALADMRRRIAETRWPDGETVADHSQGVPLAMIRELARHWATDYDWRRAEARLNALPQFVTNIEGLDIHFIHVRSKHPNALPLVISHGWPGSVLEQVKLVGPLTDPTAHGGRAEDAFHVVIPSMPGYGFSGRPTAPGQGVEWMARAWDVLMKRLGYDRYVAQGGDWGAFVVDHMGLRAPAGLLAIHTNMPATVPADVDRALLAGGPIPPGLSAEERRAYRQLDTTFKQVAYARLMGTRPQTLYGLADSPVGLAAWLLDHNDAHGQPAAAVASALTRTTSATGELTRDEILDNLTLYWLTNTGVSSSRLYWEYRGGFFNAKASPSRWRSPSSPASSTRRRGAGPSARTPGSSTTTRRTGAGTSRRGSSRGFSCPSSARRSGSCAGRGRHGGRSGIARAGPPSARALPGSDPSTGSLDHADDPDLHPRARRGRGVRGGAGEEDRTGRMAPHPSRERWGGSCAAASACGGSRAAFASS